MEAGTRKALEKDSGQQRLIFVYKNVVRKFEDMVGISYFGNIGKQKSTASKTLKAQNNER